MFLRCVLASLLLLLSLSSGAGAAESNQSLTEYIVVNLPQILQNQVSLNLVDTRTSQVITRLSDGAVITQAYGTDLNVVVEVPPELEDRIGSIHFDLDSAVQQYSHTENKAPYALCGNNAFDYKPCPIKILSYGNHVVDVSTYSKPGRGGSLVAPTVSIQFTLEPASGTGKNQTKTLSSSMPVAAPSSTSAPIPVPVSFTAATDTPTAVPAPIIDTPSQELTSMHCLDELRPLCY